jgi:hypothetical protein
MAVLISPVDEKYFALISKRCVESPNVDKFWVSGKVVRMAFQQPRIALPLPRLNLARKNPGSWPGLAR